MIGRWLGMSQIVGSALCYFILTEKCKVLARINVKNSKKNVAAKDNFQISIVHYHKCLDRDFGQVNHYALNLYGL